MPVGAEDVRAVGQADEGPVLAVGQGDVHQGHAVHRLVFGELVVGPDADVGEAQAAHPAAVLRIGGLARLFGLGVDDLGGVHRAGADAQDEALVALDQGGQADLGEEAVLGGDVAAPQDQEVAAGQQLADLVGVAAVAGGQAVQRQAGVGQAAGKKAAGFVVGAVGLGVGGQIQPFGGLFRPGGAQPRDQAVFPVEGRAGAGLKGAAGGAAGQKQGHTGSSFLAGHR